MQKEVKNSTKKNDFYLSIISSLKISTNLTNLREKLNISKQDLNYYLRELKRRNIIIQKGRGWYEVVKEVKNSTKYENFLVKDSVRGHAYIWTAKLSKKLDNWENRIEILKQKGIHFKLVGAKENTPRIKILGRKVWLCNDHLRIFDKKDQSYYGLNAKESRFMALHEIKMIVGALNNKLGINIKPCDIYFKREHYALIKNDLAIQENRKGNIWHISDGEGEWLLVDDSFGEGGELENIGKKAFQTNIPMQKWWNNHKETNFKVTPEFTLLGFDKLTNSILEEQKNIKEFAIALNKHIPAYEGMKNEVAQLNKVIKELRDEVKKLGKDG